MHVFPYGSPHICRHWQKAHCGYRASLSAEEFMERAQHFWMCLPPPQTFLIIILIRVVANLHSDNVSSSISPRLWSLLSPGSIVLLRSQRLSYFAPLWMLLFFFSHVFLSLLPWNCVMAQLASGSWVIAPVVMFRLMRRLSVYCQRLSQSGYIYLVSAEQPHHNIVYTHKK